MDNPKVKKICFELSDDDQEIKVTVTVKYHDDRPSYVKVKEIYEKTFPTRRFSVIDILTYHINDFWSW